MRDVRPLVCICIPTYNAATTIRETLISILGQQYDHLVIKVVDNASQDETLSIVQSLGNSRIQIHAHEANISAEGNFNRCIELAEGEYTAIFHADDIYESQMVGRQVAFLEDHATVGAVFCEASVIDDQGGVQGQLVAYPETGDDAFSIYTFSELFKDVLRHSNFLICPSAMLRTDLYKSHIKVWNGKDFKSSADLDVWLRSAETGAIAVLHEKLMRYRISSMQFSAALRIRVERSDLLFVIDHYLALPWVRQLLSQDDLRFARALERTDRTVRALNLYLIDRVSDARILSSKVLDREALSMVFSGRRGALTFLVALALQILISLRLSVIGKPILNWAKQRMWK